MNYLRKHWVDMGGLLAVLVLIYFFSNSGLTKLQKILWLSLVSLFIHQLEEYRIAGTFPGMVNRVMFQSNYPDRYPLNMNTSFIINVVLGWGSYLLAAVFAEKALWLGIATMMVSLGNVIAHTFIFNIKGKSWYNAGMFTCWLCFVPILFFFCKTVIENNLVHTTDFILGFLIGICFNVFGIFLLIKWLANRNTKFIFPQRNLLPDDRR